MLGFFYIFVIMYDLTRAIQCLKQAVEFKQNDNQRFPELANDLVTSDTGVQVDNPLVDVEYIWHTLNNTDANYYPEYNAGDTYSLGQRVKVTDTGINGPTSFEIFESQSNGNIGNDPETSPEWELIPLVDEYLDQVREDAIRDTLRDVMVKKKMHQEVKNLIQDIKVYRKAGRIYEKEVKNDRFVGFEIQVKKHDYLTAVLERIGLQFTEVNTDLPIYLYHASQLLPIQTILVSNGSQSSFEWQELSNVILKYNSRTHDVGGAFFIGYKESELTGQAIINKRDMSKPPCSSCSGGEYHDYIKMQPYLSVTPIYVPEVEIGASNEIWDIEKTRYIYDRNWGLNFDFSVKCDIADLFCKTKMALAEPIRINIEKKVTRMLKLNTRNNEVAQRVKGLASDELDGRENTNNLSRQYEDSIKALDFDLSALQTACVPCKNNGSKVVYTSV